MENQRIRLSKTMLKNALIELLKTKNIEKISIYELCGQAQINRTTFYKYYGSQYDLLADIENDVFNELETHLLAGESTELEKLKYVLEFLNADREKWKILINTVADQDFTEKLFSLPTIRALIRNNAPAQCTARQEEYIRLFYCQGGYAIIRKWLNEERYETPDEIAKLIISLVTMDMPSP